jgi:undecaprenyl-diphosphatase
VSPSAGRPAAADRHAHTAAAGLYRRVGLPALPLYGLASALSLSRLYLGVHYPSDVLAGALLGGAVAGSVALAHPLPREPPNQPDLV